MMILKSPRVVSILELAVEPPSPRRHLPTTEAPPQGSVPQFTPTSFSIRVADRHIGIVS